MALLAAIVPTILGIVRLTDPVRWTFGVGTLMLAAGMAATPLLHRFGPLVASIWLASLVYVHVFRVAFTAGTENGIYVTYLTACALIILLVGIEHIRIAAALAALATSLIIVLHIVVPPNTGLLSARIPVLTGFAVNIATNALILFLIVYYAVRQTARAERVAESERERSDALLANILPASVAEQLKRAPGTVIADCYDAASVLFADMAGFTVRASAMTPDELVLFLNRAFSEFDRLVEAHGLEKIKTSGDAYMVVSGVPTPRPDHADALAELALDMVAAARGFGSGVEIRVGIACGPVVAGVVGTKKFFYDVWGDTVNVASRMESTGEPGKIQVPTETYALLRERFELQERGLVEVRGKGPMRTWYLRGRKAET
jgi:adenylate cyclase